MCNLLKTGFRLRRNLLDQTVFMIFEQELQWFAQQDLQEELQVYPCLHKVDDVETFFETSCNCFLRSHVLVTLAATTTEAEGFPVWGLDMLLSRL